jgi:hypothetical protein
MSATRIIIISVVSYISLFSVAYLLFLNSKFTGDAAGSGLAKGLTFLYGLGSLFLIAIILTAVHIYLFRGVTPLWVKLISFVPLLLSTFIILTEFLGLGRPNSPTIEEQAHRLTIEIKTATKLENATLSFRSSSGGSSSKLRPIGEENGFYIYEKSTAIYFEEDRKFYVYSNEFKTPEYYLVIPYEPEASPFTDWSVIYGINNNEIDSVMLEFRYKITK